MCRGFINQLLCRGRIVPPSDFAVKAPRPSAAAPTQDGRRAIPALPSHAQLLEGFLMESRVKCLTLCIGLLGVSFASAQEPAAPKPGPEHQRLGYFVGNWTSEGEMKPSEMGPGGKMTSTEKCEWFEGKFAVVCRGQGRSPWGPGKSIGILSYSPEEKVYTYYGVDNTGMTMATVPHGTVKGDTWTYDDESMMGGKKVKTRVTIKELSPTAYTFKMETQGPDGKWAPMMESKSTKTK
jgi:Protein of unknown function (DUF1579)